MIRRCSALILLSAVSLAAPLDLQAPASSSEAALPVVIWHGLGDNFQNPGLKSFADDINERFNVSTHIVHLADDGSSDQRASFFGRAHEQVAYAAEQIKSIPELAHGYDAVGFSQGGQLLRALAEYHPDPPMRNLITVGSQHMGITDFPECSPRDLFCKAAKWALRVGAWQVQDKIIPAQYYRNQASISEYLQNSAFLRELNNERWGDRQVGGSEDYLDQHPDESGDQSPRNRTLKANLEKLSNLVLMGFSDDRTVVPWTSSYFTLLNVSDSKPIKLSALPLYQDDYIGLRTLDERGALHYGTCQGEHMQIDEDCWERVMNWLGPQKRSPSESSFVVQG